MKIEHTPDALVLSEFGEFLAGLLNRITICSDPLDSPKAKERLYSNPTKEEAQLNADWQEYVQPDLKHQFESANEVVSGDLAAIEQARKRKEPEFLLEIPLSHVESWLNSLNQARLALAANFEITEEDMDGEPPEVFASERDLAIFQIHLYGFLQECLIQATDVDE